MKWKNVLLVLLASIALVVLLAQGFRLNPRAVPSVLEGKRAPQCNLIGLNHQPLALTDFQGKSLVLNFWASWCVPCVHEHQVLQQAALKYASAVQFVGVLYQDNPQAAQAFLQQYGQNYAHATDPNSRCAIDFGVSGVPETFFVDQHGMVVKKHVGPVSRELLEHVLDPILKEDLP